MSKIQAALLIALLLAVGLVAAGVWLVFSAGVALIVGGVLLAVVSVLIASEVSG